MRLLKWLFSSTQTNTSDSTKEDHARGKYLPEEKTPIDEAFTKHFIHNGGKFLYCENVDEIHTQFDHILLENDWYERKVITTHSQLANTFKGFNLEFTDLNCDKAAFMLTDCEALVSKNGSILFSSKQLKEKKVNELPTNIIVYATTRQYVETISEGLRQIKQRNQKVLYR